MSKADKVRELLEGVEACGWPLEYAGYFHHFNAGRYYEAHDVLEQLWLPDRKGAHGDFYKGLIQFAGAFVHLQKGRLGPSLALFRLSQKYLEAYAPATLGLDLVSLFSIGREWSTALEISGANPLLDRLAPQLHLDQATA